MDPLEEPGQATVPVDTTALTRSAGRGALWQVAGAGWQTVLQLGSSMVLARVLFPKDYGMLGMAMLVQGLVGRVGALGTTAGVIAKEKVTDEDLSTAFWTTLGVQVLLFVVSFSVAPLAVLYFKPGEDSGYADVGEFRDDLTTVIRAVALTFLTTALGQMSATVMRKRLQFGALKIIEGGGFAIQCGVAIVLAVVFKMNYWSLVASIIVSSLAMSAAAAVWARWRPRWCFNWESFRFQFRFGTNELGSAVVGYFHHNTDYLVIGGLLGQGVLGLYEFSRRLPYTLFDRLALPINAVLFPALAKVQSSNELLAGGYIKTTRYVAMIVFPLMGGLAAVAPVAVSVLWGDRWLAAIVPLQILCLSTALRCMTAGVGPVFLCRNRPDIPFKFDLTTLVSTVVSVVGLGYLFGVNGVAAGMVVAWLPSVLLLGMALKMTRCRPMRLLAALAPPFVGTLVCAAAAMAAVRAMVWQGAPDIVTLIVSVAAGGTAYVGSVGLLYPEVIRDLWRTVLVIIGVKARPAA